ncbi:UPF0149 family protein [Bradyrhizobium liaoningense]
MTKPKQGRGTRKARKTTMADYAMSFERLGQWISKRARSPTLRHPRATSLSMLDGAVAAVVAGPVSMASEEWVCPLLGVDPDAFNHDTEEFSAIAATLMRHNAISETLSTRPESFEPLFVRSPDGEVDPQPWCMGFYAVKASASRLVAASPPEWNRTPYAAADLGPLHRRRRSTLATPGPAHAGNAAHHPKRLAQHSSNRRGPPAVLDAYTLQARCVGRPHQVRGSVGLSYRLHLSDGRAFLSKVACIVFSPFCRL